MNSILLRETRLASPLSHRNGREGRGVRAGSRHGDPPYAEQLESNEPP
jgi:hypothetical protein